MDSRFRKGVQRCESDAETSRRTIATTLDSVRLLLAILVVVAVGCGSTTDTGRPPDPTPSPTPAHTIPTTPSPAPTASLSPTATETVVFEMGFGLECYTDMSSAIQYEHGLEVAEEDVVGFATQEGLLVEFQSVGVSWMPGDWARSWSHSTM